MPAAGGEVNAYAFIADGGASPCTGSMLCAGGLEMMTPWRPGVAYNGVAW